MPKQPIILEVVDTSGLTDADWAEINNLKSAYEAGGQAALAEAMATLSEADPVRATRVVAAFFPDLVRETVRDLMAEKGITVEDLREMLQKLENPSQSKH
jgi:hypothetical protein